MLTYIKLFLIVIHTIIWSLIAMLSLAVDRSYTMYFWVSRMFPKGILDISRIKLKVTGLENLDSSELYVYVSNHSSMYDIPAMQIAFPNRATMMFKKELAKIPIFGWQLYLGPYIIVDRESGEKARKSIDRAIDQMKKRRISLLLFAEGTRSKTGEVQPFKRGAFNLAAKIGVPVVPTSISGTAAILPKGKLRITPGTITVHFDKPIPTTNVKNRADEIELMNKVREIVIQNKVN